ncbi:MAG: hypothetical protein H7Z13_07875 [Ferruginibacter sp.]|nr:hypothetical protein [Ferruginibacter sp.]
MEPNQLKTAWNDIAGENKNGEELKLMIRENRHPVLKGIRLQLMIEITAWTFFLFVYYDMFDGDRRPFYVNLLLVVAVLLLLLHSIMGYLSAKYLVKGNTLHASLLNYLVKIKLYAMISVSSRVITIICVLIFFMATITFTPAKYLLLAGILLLIPLQVFLLSRIWGKRIKKLTEALNGLREK